MNLKELGLTEYEQRAYQGLIRHGKLSASHTSRVSEVPYGKIYEVLASLESKGLVRIIPEKTKMFAPSDPANLQKLIDKKEADLKALRKDVEQLKQTYDHIEKEPVVIMKGRKNFYKIIQDMRKPEKYSYAVKWSSDVTPLIFRNYRKAKDRGIIQKTLARVDEETLPNLKKWKKEVGTAGKVIENKGVAIGINDKETMIVLTKKNTIMLIRDESFCEVLKQLFEAYYDKAEEIKV